MVGPQESSPPTPPKKTFEERHEQLLAELDEQQKRLCLPSFSEYVNHDTKKYENMPESVIRAMSPEDCETAAILLIQLAHYVQRYINRLLAVIKWCEENINSLVAPVVSKMPGNGYAERRMMAIRSHDVAQKIEATRVKASVYLQDVDYEPLRLEKKAQHLSYLAQKKVKHHG